MEKISEVLIESTGQTVKLEGEKGTTFTPSVDANGNLSWTNDGGKQNPTTVNIKGERGEKGDTTVIDPSTSTTYTLYNQTGKHTDGAMTQAAVTEEFEKLDETYARLDGYYESMGVGMATNLKGQNTVDAEFAYRKSGGNVEVQDGNAMIEAIKGNTVAWNQLVDTNTTQVTPVNGRKICTVAGGVKSIVTSDGSAISVSGGTDMVFDLTLIYGSGKEPSTPEQFEQDYFNWFGKPLTYEPYDAGSLRNTKVSALKTTGFNLWDEQWVNGYVSSETGNVIKNSTNTIASKNLIPVISGKTYYLSTRGAYITIYDVNQAVVGQIYTDKVNTFDLGTNVHYIRFHRDSYGTTYNNDICINLSDPNRNGEYEPYKESTLPLDVTTLTGKLNGEGSSIVVFADGMNSYGDVHDEICVVDGVTKAIKRVGSSHEVLAEPEVYVLDDFNLPKLYHVANGGTEEQLSNSPNSLPATLSIRYGLNAAAFIQNAPKNYISKESMTNFLSNLGSAMGGTWTMTWNSSTNKYDFSFTQNRSVENVEQPIEDK